MMVVAAYRHFRGKIETTSTADIAQVTIQALFALFLDTLSTQIYLLSPFHPSPLTVTLVSMTWRYKALIRVLSDPNGGNSGHRCRLTTIDYMYLMCGGHASIRGSSLSFLLPSALRHDPSHFLLEAIMMSAGAHIVRGEK